MNTMGFPTKEELKSRIGRLHSELIKSGGDWDAALIVGRVNQFYLTGTMQDGVFVLRRDGAFCHYVYKSYERAVMESPLEEIYDMSSFREISGMFHETPKRALIETDVITYSLAERLRSYVGFTETGTLDSAIMSVRAVKSDYEIECMRYAGVMHRKLHEEVVPSLLREGISEAELAAEMIREMIINLDYHGIARFSRFQTELVVGQMGFSENSLYPTSFDGPGGMLGLSPAVPMVGSRERKLRRGDLIFLDYASGYNGYFTDRTTVYMFGAEPDSAVAAAHRRCLERQKATAALLLPGNTPESIYAEITADGFQNRNSKFLGHGVGLHIDEFPVIARGFSEPLVPGMALAIEPKAAVEGVGLVGDEDTYLVRSDGAAECLTQGEKDIIVVK